MAQDYRRILFYADTMSASVSIRMLLGVAEQNLARSIFDEVWPTDEGTQITANLLQALVHNGTYISGAFIDGEIVAAAFAFPGRDSHGNFHLHSHMAAVKEEYRNQNIGSQIKWHQREWAMKNGYDTITWTFDPLVRRNAKLNLVKLGVQVFEYFPDFYGDLPDALNAGDPTDRAIAHWRLNSERVSDALNHKLEFSNNHLPVALANSHGSPLPQRVEEGASTILCYMPEDIIEMRSTNPALALQWRLALRKELQPRLERGWTISGFTGDGAYIVRHQKGDR